MLKNLINQATQKRDLPNFAKKYPIIQENPIQTLAKKNNRAI